MPYRTCIFKTLIHESALWVSKIYRSSRSQVVAASTAPPVVAVASVQVRPLAVRRSLSPPDGAASAGSECRPDAPRSRVGREQRAVCSRPS